MEFTKAAPVRGRSRAQNLRDVLLSFDRTLPTSIEAANARFRGTLGNKRFSSERATSEGPKIRPWKSRLAWIPTQGKLVNKSA